MLLSSKNSKRILSGQLIFDYFAGLWTLTVYNIFKKSIAFYKRM